MALYNPWTSRRKAYSQPWTDKVEKIIRFVLLQLFHSVTDESIDPTPLHLVGVVCYYGKHYSTFFFHSKVHEWIYFDDATVKQVGYTAI